MNALQLIDTDVLAFSADASKKDIVKSMEAKNMEHASIIKKNKWLGYVSLTSLIASNEEDLTLLIEEGLSKTYFLPNQHLYEIYPSFQRSVLSEISIIDEGTIVLLFNSSTTSFLASGLSCL